MSMLSSLSFFSIILFYCAFPLSGKKIELSAPEVLLSGWNARCLDHADFNGDGLEDLVYFNLDKSYLEILYRNPADHLPTGVRPSRLDRWEPVLEDALYTPERIFVSGSITDLTIGDLNGDNHLDLITGSPDDGVLVYFREENSTWSEPLVLECGKIRSYSMSLQVIENSSSDSVNLFVFTEGGLEQISFLSGKPEYPTKLFREESKKAYGLDLMDLNGDHHLDWLYLISGDENSLRIRLGNADGFGPEKSFPVKLSSFPAMLKNSERTAGTRFCSIDSISGEAIVFSLSPKAPPEETLIDRVNAYDLFPESTKQSSWAWGDFDSDGINDLVASTFNRSEIIFLRGLSSGEFASPKTYPSLLGISSLSANKIHNGASLLLFSPEEEVIGLSKFTKQKGFEFPMFLKVSGEPKLAESLDYDADGIDEILTICERKEGFFLETYSYSSTQGYKLAHSFEFEDMDKEPVSLFPCKLNNDNQTDLLLLFSRDAPRVLLGGSNGKWTEGAKDSIIRKSFLKGVDQSELSTRSTPKGENLLVGRRGYVREISWEKDDFKIINQFNAKNQSGDLQCPFYIRWKPDQSGELIAYHEDGYWERLHGEGLDLMNSTRMKGALLEPNQVLVENIGKTGRFISLGKSGFEVIEKGTQPELSLKIESRYLTDLPKIRHNGIETGDFNGDSIPDLVCLDGKKNLLEFLTLDSPLGEWRSQLHFEVFEKNLHYQGKKGGLFEPREGIVVDADGDNLDDLVFLVHNRLLLYRQLSSKNL